jgi:hypothetical protein
MRSRELALSVIISVLFLFVSEGRGAESQILNEIKSSTTYIFIKNANTFIPNGTGFFVGLKVPSKPNNFGLCLVTPKHVLYQPGTTQFLDTIYIRLNKKGGGSELAAIPIRAQGKDKTIFMHSDPSVDLVAMQILPDQKRYDLKFIPDQFILSKEISVNINIYEGFEVFFPSLFFPAFGSAGNYPFIRFGRFALITDEKIAWQGKPTALYLIDTGSCGANSGAPVFFFMESNRASVLKLAGVIQGTFGDALQEIKITEKNKTPLPFSNVGIAGVIPAYKLYELLFSEELKKQRGF